MNHAEEQRLLTQNAIDKEEETKRAGQLLKAKASAGELTKFWLHCWGGSVAKGEPDERSAERDARRRLAFKDGCGRQNIAVAGVGFASFVQRAVLTEQDNENILELSNDTNPRGSALNCVTLRAGKARIVLAEVGRRVVRWVANRSEIWNVTSRRVTQRTSTGETYEAGKDYFYKDGDVSLARFLKFVSYRDFVNLYGADPGRVPTIDESNPEVVVVAKNYCASADASIGAAGDPGTDSFLDGFYGKGGKKKKAKPAHTPVELPAAD